MVCESIIIINFDKSCTPGQHKALFHTAERVIESFSEQNNLEIKVISTKSSIQCYAEPIEIICRVSNTKDTN